MENDIFRKTLRYAAQAMKQRKHNFSRLAHFAACLFLTAFAETSLAQPLSVSTSVDKTTLAVNEQLVFTIELSGEGANGASNPELPEMGGFLSLLGSSGTSQSIQIINGRMTVQKSQTYYYMAAKEGTFQIPPVKVSYKGVEYQSNPINITITKSAGNAAPPANQPQSRTVSPEAGAGDDLFIRAIPNKRRVYQNEAVIVTYRIYTQVNVSSYGVSKLPETAGFWAEDFDQGQPQTREEVLNGKKYVVADIKKVALFPTSSGSKTIGSLVIDCDVRMQSRRRTTDIFDSFFDDPFFNRTVRKSIYSKPIEVEVLPLPSEGRPGNFSGAVGDFRLEANIDKQNVKTNEAISLKIKISGVGNIKILPQPQLAIPSDFQQYDPKVTENISRQGGAISGSKTFEYVLVPRFPGEQQIRPFEFSYFDPQAATYRTLSSPSFSIHVTKGADDFVSLGPGLSKEEVRLVGQDIRFIKLTTSQLTPIGKRLYTSFAFISLSIVPLILLIGSVAYRSHLEKLSGNVAYARRRRANRMAMKKLSKAYSLLDEKTQKQFYAEASRALLGFAADKLNLSEAGIITSEIEKRLIDHNLESNLIQSYMKLVQTCDYQRFAPANISKSEMEEFYQQAKEAIINLEKAL
jgi:hypothetical protein